MVNIDDRKTRKTIIISDELHNKYRSFAFAKNITIREAIESQLIKLDYDKEVVKFLEQAIKNVKARLKFDGTDPDSTAGLYSGLTITLENINKIYKGEKPKWEKK